jgi:para-aminobenzoate synthetase component 1
MKHVPVTQNAPLWREIAYDDPARMAEQLRGRAHLLFLDSAKHDQALGRYSYVACDPFLSFAVDANETGQAALARLDRLLDLWRLPPIENLPPFQGGFAGYFAYEFGRLLEPQIMARTPAPRIPPAVLHAYDAVVAFDHEMRRAFIVSTGLPETAPQKRIARARDRIAEIEALLQRDPPPRGSHRITGFTSNFDRPRYEDAIRRTIDLILAGDIFQANIAQTFSAHIPQGFDTFAYYSALRHVNPATFGAYLEFGDLVIASSSPERLLSFDGMTAEARPIKGTRPRDADPRKDAALKAELLASRKDRAENVMIVDLLRNDLSRVCNPGSVQVPMLCGLETYASVHHLTSVVTGRLSRRRTRGDLIAACFPGGSITGAPKIRAQEIIAEMEGIPRDVYCGSIGFLGFNGTMDLNIAIRTVLFHNSKARLQGGGGITARSNPAEEYDETLDKVRNILKAGT